VAALDLIRLGRLTARPELETRGRELMSAFSAEIADMPGTYSFMLAGLDFAIGPSREIVIAEGGDGATAREMAEAVYARFIPNTVVLMKPAAEDAAARIIDLAPFLAGHRARDGRTAAYVCTDHSCLEPVSTVGDLEALLAR
jgi:hypothetical protein